MLATLLQAPLILLPIIQPAPPVGCQLDVVPAFVLEERVIVSFNDRVEHYVRIHRRLERWLPPEHLFADAEDMSAAVDALHVAIVESRPNARAGAFFTPVVADVLSKRLERAIVDNGYTAAEVLAAINAGYLPGMPEPEINGRFPAVRDAKVWPALLAALPQLPQELQYRFVDRDLVLVDVHADLVVDILKEALPAASVQVSQPAVY